MSRRECSSFKEVGHQRRCQFQKSSALGHQTARLLILGVIQNIRSFLRRNFCGGLYAILCDPLKDPAGMFQSILDI